MKDNIADLLKEIVNKAVETIGASMGTARSIDKKSGLCEITPIDGSPIVIAQLHKGQMPKLGSKIAYISSHLDKEEEVNYTVVHVFDYDEQLIKANKRIVIHVSEDNIYLVNEDAQSPAVLGDKLARILEDFKSEILNHIHPYPGTAALPSTVVKTATSNIESMKSSRVFLE